MKEIETSQPTRRCAIARRLRSCKLRRFYRIFVIMTKYTARVLALAALLGGCASSVSAQTAAVQPLSPQAAPASQGGTPTICGQQVPAPATLPPEGSGPVLYLIAVCFP